MKKARSEENDWLRPEYNRADLGEVVRGKYAHRLCEPRTGELNAPKGGVLMKGKKSTGRQTSAKDASLAAKLLRNPNTPAKVKSVAASDLSQRAPKPKKGR
jgi:hypothetical protein